MRLLKCPKPEALFEYVSIAHELSIREKAPTWLHLKTCTDCQEKSSAIARKWDSLLSPEPDITSSLLKVYSRLQRDETLILKGWKLGETRQQRRNETRLLSDWAFRGTIAASLLGVIAFIGWSQLNSNRDGGKELINASAPLLSPSQPVVPFAQIRIEDKNRIKVQYVQPQLLQTMEFETTNAR